MIKKFNYSLYETIKTTFGMKRKIGIRFEKIFRMINFLCEIKVLRYLLQKI